MTTKSKVENITVLSFFDKKIFYGWIIVGVAFLSMAVGYALRYSFTVLSVSIEEDFDWSRSSIHIAFSILALTYGFSGPLTGYLMDRYGPRIFMPLGAVLMGIGLIGCSQISQLWHLYVFYSISAIGMSCLGIVCFGTLISNWFVKMRGTAWGLAASGTGFGMFFIVGFFVPWLIEAYGFRATYFILGIVGILLIAPLTNIFLRHKPEDIGLHPDGSKGEFHNSNNFLNKSYEQKQNTEYGNVVWTLSKAIRSIKFWAVCLCFFCYTLAMYSVMIHQVSHAVDVGFDISEASQAFGIIGLLGMLGKFFWGFISDRIGREWAYSLGAVCIIISIILFSFLKDPSQIWMLRAFAVIFGLGYGVSQPVTTAIIADLFQGPSLGKIMGLLVLGASIGGAIGPSMSGIFFDLTGNYRSVFALSIFLACIAIVCVWVAAPRKVKIN